jgi:hypothetical protein
VVLAGVAGAVHVLRPGASPSTPRAAADAAASPQPAATSGKTFLPYVEAAPILDSHRSELPAELRALPPAGREAAWTKWAAGHDAAIRARLEHGDEDSIVNLWLYGTSFTARSRVTGPDMAQRGGGATAEEIIQGRLDDLLAGVVAPGANDRLQFVRETLARHGIDPRTPDGRDQAQRYLSEAALRMAAEQDRYHRAERTASTLDAAHRLAAFATMFRDRGLSSDTRLPIEFALEQTLADALAKGKLGPGRVRRVAIVGPGLDFSDKAEGYDFYPQQTVQPFAVIDSLARLGLATLNDLRITTFDLSPRVNQHLAAARERARGGLPYVLQLPLAEDEPSRQWQPELVTYWQHLGDRIGDEVPAIPVPPTAGRVRLRAVRVRPDVVLAITPLDVDIVVERLAPLSPDDRFDLIVATNILVYYSVFEQSLALSNIASMLRPGGFLLSNNVLVELPTTPLHAIGDTRVIYSDHPDDSDDIVWYRRP